ncbi:MAG: hypothetical protein AB7S48_13505 [Bacteroidales bacterium]
MRKILSFLVVLAFSSLTSCIDDNDTSIVFTDYIVVEAANLPDTVTVNTPLEISLHAYAPNQCWSNIRFASGVRSDTICTYAAVATFENHGETCADGLVTKDTVYTFTPTLEKKYIFQFAEYTTLVRDTVVVIAAE